MVCSTGDGTAWSGATRVAAVDGRKSAPRIAAFQNALWIPYVAQDKGVYVQSSSNGSTWSDRIPVRQTANGGCVGIAGFNGGLVVLFIDDANALMACTSPDGRLWSDALPVHQDSLTGPDLAAFHSRLWLCFTANNASQEVLVCSSANATDWSDNVPV